MTTTKPIPANTPTMTASSIGRVVASIVSALALLLLAAGLTACGDDAPAELRGYTREPTPDAAGLTLPDLGDDGAAFELVGPDDGLLVIYFGYTRCPDVCPTTLSDIGVALDRLGDDADRVTVAMATIDPDRDTIDVLPSYLDHFGDGWKALRTTDDDELRVAADAFGVSYQVIPADDGGEPEVVHTGSLFAVDDGGRIVVTWPFGTPAADYAHDLAILLDR